MITINNHKLNEDKIGGATVKVDILPSGKCIPNSTITPKKITIHDTGNLNTKASNNHNYMKNCNKNGSRIASWHFTVDHDIIIQAIPCNKKGYHAGNSTGNNSSIGIEMCIYSDSAKQLKVYENAIELVKILMKQYKIDSTNIVQHNYWTGKNCPGFLRANKYGYNWSWFKGKLNTVLPSSSSFLVKVIASELNVRKGPSHTYKVNTVIKKGEVYTIVDVKNNWGKLKSGVGWINLSYTNKI